MAGPAPCTSGSSPARASGLTPGQSDGHGAITAPASSTTSTTALPGSPSWTSNPAARSRPAAPACPPSAAPRAARIGTAIWPALRDLAVILIVVFRGVIRRPRVPGGPALGALIVPRAGQGQMVNSTPGPGPGP